MRDFWRGIWLSGLIFVSFSSSALTPDCESILHAAVSEGELSATQAQRLYFLLYGRLSKPQRLALFRGLSQENLPALAAAFRVSSASGTDALIGNSGVQTFTQDLAEFGDGWPGIFAGENADRKVERALHGLIGKEAAFGKAPPDVLRQEMLAPQLRRSIEKTVLNLISQLNNERSRRGAFGRLRDDVRQIYSRTFTKVERIISFARILERELARLQTVDRVIIEALDDPSLSDDEFQQLMWQLMSAPQEVSLVELEMVRVFGSDFSIKNPVPVGGFDIKKIAALAADGLNLDRIRDSFRDENLKALAELDRVLNRSRGRQNQSARGEPDRSLGELQIEFESRKERAEYARGLYEKSVAIPANETYTVTQQIERIVGSGHSAIRRLENEKVTITPSIADLLNDRFASGRGDYSKAEAYRERTKDLRSHEKPAMELMSAAEELIRVGMQNRASMDEAERAKFLTRLAAKLELIRAQIPQQKAYIGASLVAPFDTAEAFKKRNNAVLTHLVNSERALVCLGELIRRHEVDFHHSYTVADFSVEMRSLEKAHLQLRLDQAALASVAIMATTVLIVPELREFVEALPSTFGDQLLQFIASLRTYFPL